MSKFTYSKVIGSLNDDSIKCSPNDLNCLENSPVDNSPAEELSGSFMYIVWSLYYSDEENTSNEKINELDIEIQDDEGLAADEYLLEPAELKISMKNHTEKVKRSLELAEEQPPEGTNRPPVDEGETRTTQPLHTSPECSSLPSLPSDPPGPTLPSINLMTSTPSMSSTLITPSSMPSIPQPPTMPTGPSISQPPTIPPTNTQLTNDVTTSVPEVEVLETTTEDYGNVGEPNCDYDPFTFVLKCGLSLITSIFGLSDTCCKPIF